MKQATHSLKNASEDLKKVIFTYEGLHITANDTITILMQYELSQVESDLLKAGLYFSNQTDKI